MPLLPKQGYENNAQDPAKYNANESAAVTVVTRWISTLNHHDTDAHMALIDRDVLVRPDAYASVMHGPGRYCATVVGIGPNQNGNFLLNELYAVGGRWETDVLLRRTDINAPAGGAGPLAGYPVPVATFLRIRGGKIIEWEDMPTTDVLGEAANSGVRRLLDGPPTPGWCRKYESGSAIASAPAVDGNSLGYWYGTTTQEYYWNSAEKSAASAVRAWFAAWQAGDPLLLGSFVDSKVVFRADPGEPLGHGRENLLRGICNSIGGKRKLIDLFVVGGDYDSAVLTRWDAMTAKRSVRHMSSMFRVQHGLITEWMYDRALDESPQSITASSGARSSGKDSVACREVDAALAPTAGIPRAMRLGISAGMDGEVHAATYAASNRHPTTGIDLAAIRGVVLLYDVPVALTPYKK
jgi:hypothetical protein